MSASSSSSSSPLSDLDAHTLYDYGLDVTQDAIGIIIETIFMSVYGVFFALALYSICRKVVKSLGSFVMLCVVVYLYAASFVLWALDITQWFMVAQSLFLDNPNIPLPNRRDVANDRTAIFATPMEALFMFNMLVGDTVVIWRAWVLYQHPLSVMWVPCLMLAMSFFFNVIDIMCLMGFGFTEQTAVAGGGAVCRHAELVSWAFSLVTNASCTILIGYKAWQLRQMKKSLHIHSDRSSRRLTADKILSLLVESGFIYCFFLLTQLVLFVPLSRFNASIYLYESFGPMGNQISGMYPTLIIVIVNFHQTIWEESVESVTTILKRESEFVTTKLRQRSGQHHAPGQVQNYF
ncbi:hypothetical protein GGX14DRAFT_672365 [Mycena pura]|uniref:Uncharacterized protein n=1 Tax=Mycena pura TaxID=153505 RepID=A0AAD6UXD6_9AGAR|nr:hypothetical protein GGX14DRAFT_672365 [Mycena pura]